MEVLKVNGGTPLRGEYSPKGAKNAVLPIMASSIMIDGEIILHQVPNLTDVKGMCDILKEFHCKVRQENDTIIINTRNIDKGHVSEDLMKTMRASNLIWGPLLSRFGEAEIPMPGGCPIGSRPMDIHSKGLQELGATVVEEGGSYLSHVQQLKGAEIYLDFPSVGATENLICAAVRGDGVTILRNVAKEPEVGDLCQFLNAAGGKIQGLGSDTLVIEGVPTLHSVEYSIVPDRIVAGTLLLAAAITGGKVTLNPVVPEHLEAILAKLHQCGAALEKTRNSITLQGSSLIFPTNIKTLPHPGFPTDIQPQFVSLLSLAKGTSIIQESIFENRFQHCHELKKMGADISVDGHLAVVKGVKSLGSAKVEAADLRGGAALLLGALTVKEETEISQIHHIDRGYCQIEKMLNALGADIVRT